jgi:hypothetical protein
LGLLFECAHVVDRPQLGAVIIPIAMISVMGQAALA